MRRLSDSNMIVATAPTGEQSTSTAAHQGNFLLISSMLLRIIKLLIDRGISFVCDICTWSSWMDTGQ